MFEIEFWMNIDLKNDNVIQKNNALEISMNFGQTKYKNHCIRQRISVNFIEPIHVWSSEMFNVKID